MSPTQTISRCGGTPATTTFPGLVASLATTYDLRGYWRLGEAVAGPFVDSQPTYPPADLVRQIVGGAAPTHIAGALPAAQDDGALQLNNANTTTGDWLHAGDPGFVGGTGFRFNYGVGDANMSVTAFVRPLANASAFRGGVLGTLRSIPMGGWGLVVEWPTRYPSLWRRDPGGGFAVILDGPSLTAATWSFVAATYDTVVGHSLYVNGALAASNAALGDVETYNLGVDTVAVRSTDFADSKLFYGGLDEITTWGEALPAATVASLYAASL